MSLDSQTIDLIKASLGVGGGPTDARTAGLSTALGGSVRTMTAAEVQAWIAAAIAYARDPVNDADGSVLGGWGSWVWVTQAGWPYASGVQWNGGAAFGPADISVQVQISDGTFNYSSGPLVPSHGLWTDPGNPLTIQVDSGIAYAGAGFLTTSHTIIIVNDGSVGFAQAGGPSTWFDEGIDNAAIAAIIDLVSAFIPLPAPFSPGAACHIVQVDVAL